MPREGLGLPASAVHKATQDSLGEIWSLLPLRGNVGVPTLPSGAL